jgi:hypothetical protein
MIGEHFKRGNASSHRHDRHGIVTPIVMAKPLFCLANPEP